jgi:hypothetical protein
MQREDWLEAAVLADQAADLGYEPLNPAEWIPVFEAYVNSERLDEAQRTAKKIRKFPDLRHLYCSQDWNSQNTIAFKIVCGSN